MSDDSLFLALQMSVSRSMNACMAALITCIVTDSLAKKLWVPSS